MLNILGNLRESLKPEQDTKDVKLNVDRPKDMTEETKDNFGKSVNSERSFTKLDKDKGK